MNNMMAATAVLTLISGGPAWAQQDHGGHAARETTFSVGEPGEAGRPGRTIQVTMTEADGGMLFAPDKLELREGDQVRFVLRNAGELDHEFVLGTTEDNQRHAASMSSDAAMEHEEPNAKRFAPKSTGEIVWRFTNAGRFEYACLIPGHREAGMIGTITVK